MTLLLLAAPSLAATLNVGPSQTYASIAAAVAAAASGDTIQVYPGRYAESIDLRGKNLTVTGVDGPRVTVLAPTATIQIDGGALRGFRIEPAPATAIQVPSGSPLLRELEIVSPSTYGIEVFAGSPTIEEVLVEEAGLHAFILRSGTPVVRRSIAWSPASYGFALKTAVEVSNSLAVDADYAFVTEAAGSVLSHVVALRSRSAALATLAASSLDNVALRDNAAVVRCFGAASSFSNGIMWNDVDAVDCTGTPLAGLIIADPLFAAWDTASNLYAIDLRAGPGSPMLNAGSGNDPDGTVADLGMFGGPDAGWTDADADGVPVLFDCDDHDRTTRPGATERDDDLDNDCDDIVDEDVPVDTGGGDTGDSADTGTDDTADSGQDTDTSVPVVDLDGDGFASDVDCGEHNIATYPGARERTDGVDNDCDGRIDNGTLTGDDDGDGFTELAGDCDDTDLTRYPGANDTFAPPHGVDYDCSGLSDNPTGFDADGDGFRDNVDDCDDTDASVHPGAPDGADGVDSDCDGVTDDDAFNDDIDRDGQSPAQGDCDDANAAVYFGALDVPDDFVDQDCTGEDNYDVDRDGDPSFVSGGTDCNDDNSRIAPALGEACDDGLDNDCDDLVDEECSADTADAADEGCGCAATRSAPGGTALALGGLLAGALLRRRARVGTRERDTGS